MKRFKRVLRRFVLTALVAVLALGVVLAINTFRFASRQIDVKQAEVVDLDETALARRLAKAIRLKTISFENRSDFDPKPFLQMHALLEESFPNMHAHLTKTTVGDYSLLYHWAGKDQKAKPILLMSHLDVVPVEANTEETWEYPPFAGEVAEGFIWGRGALDVKNGVMAICEAVESLLADNFQPAVDVYLAFGHDEELGGAEGNARVAALLKDRKVRLEFVIDEGGALLEGVVQNVKPPVAFVGVAEKGFLSVELTTVQSGGHSSMPPPETAVEIIAAAVQRLKANQLPVRLSGGADLMLDFTGPEMPLPRRLIVANRWLFSGLLSRQISATPTGNAVVRTTTAGTMLAGGVKANVLPGRARAVVNFRILPGDTIDSVLKHVQSTIDDSRVTIHPIGKSSQPCKVANIESESFQRLHRTIREIFPDVLVAPGVLVAGTDSRYYMEIADNVYRFIPARLGRNDLARIHGVDERISVSHYANIVRFFRRLLTNLNRNQL